MSRILIVDDDKVQRMISTHALEKVPSYKLEEAVDGKEALERVLDNKKPSIDLVLLDHFMPNMDGMETLKRIRENYPTLPVIIVTANNELEEAVEYMRCGASDFISKPFNTERLRLSVRHNLTLRTLSHEVSRLTRKERGQGQFSDMIGAEAGLAPCVAMGKKAASSDISLLITGESGTGKELFARAVHGESHRASHKFVAINCGAIPENLVESTLFGHEKGSFTGAIAKEIGKFREADGGTLFLDEVAELKPDMQTKLLRVLQQKEVQPVGAGSPVPVNVRIISATHRNMLEEVAAGRFREDLYYRLNVLPIQIPALSQRRTDIPAIVEHLLERICATEGKTTISISEGAMEWLCQQTWKGNVRELENMLYRAVVLSEKDVMDTDFLQNLYKDVSQPRKPEGADCFVMLIDEQGRPRTMEAIEQDCIQSALRRSGMNVTEAARILGMGQSTIYKKIAAKSA